MASGHKIRRLIKEFYKAEGKSELAHHMMYYKDTPEDERFDWENECYCYESKAIDIANEVKKMEPSKYMWKKYEVELETIMEYVV